MSLMIRARDENRVPQGTLPALSCKLTEVENGMDTWTISLSGNDELAANLQEGWGVIVYENKEVRFSGKIEKENTRIRGNSVITTISGATDKKVLRNRRVYPNPLQGFDQQTSAYWKQTGLAEDLIADVINKNAGPESGFSVRRTPGLRSVISLGRGISTNINARFSVLSEEVATLALLGGLVVDVRQVQGSTDLEVLIRQPQDLSRAVRFFPGAGLGDFEMERSAPTKTTIIVMGQGEGAARKIYGRSLPGVDQWAGERIEHIVDRRDTNIDAELHKTILENFEEGKETQSITFELNESEGRMYGVDFQLGDIISVKPIAKGNTIITKKVTEVETTWTEFNGKYPRKIKLSVGESTVKDTLEQIKSVEKDLRDLEVRK